MAGLVRMVIPGLARDISQHQVAIAKTHKTKQPNGCFVLFCREVDYLRAISKVLPAFDGPLATWSSPFRLGTERPIPGLPAAPQISVREYWLPTWRKISFSVVLEASCLVAKA